MRACSHISFWSKGSHIDFLFKKRVRGMRCLIAHIAMVSGYIAAAIVTVDIVNIYGAWRVM